MPANIMIEDVIGAYETLGVALRNLSNLTFTADGSISGSAFEIFLDGNSVRSFNGIPRSPLSYSLGLVSLDAGEHTIQFTGYTYRFPAVPNPVVETVTETFIVHTYFPPSISLFSAKRCDSAGALKDDGTYVKYSLTGSIDPIHYFDADQNTTLIRLRYRVDGTETWSYHTLTSTLFSVNDIDVVLNLGLSAGSTFDFGAILEDYRTNATVETTLPRDLVVLSWNDDRLALGKIAEIAGFDVAWASRFRDVATFDEAPVFSDKPNSQKALNVGTMAAGSVSMSLAADALTTQAVTFPEGRFSSVPHVVATMNYAMTYSSTSQCLVAVDSITETGFNIKVMRRGGALDVVVQWEASQIPA